MNGDLFPHVRLAPEAEPDERYTPARYFEAWHREFGFTLDVCATEESAKCDRFLTVAEDGLKESWSGERVWCNPPYSDIEPWVLKAWSSRAELVVMLLPAWTDRAWWADLVEPFRDGRDAASGIGGRTLQPTWLLSTRFLPSRIPFGFPGNPEGVGAGSPPFWSCLLIWRGA